MRHIFFIFFIFTSLLGFTQKNNFGFKGGYILSNQKDGLNNLEYKPLSSFQVGILYSIGVSKNINLQPELSYSNKGAKINSGKLILRTFEIPLLMSYEIKSVSIVAGPQYSQIFKVKWKDNLETYNENFSMSNIGFVVGLNYTFNEHLLIGTRFQKDITNNTSLIDYYPKTLEIDYGNQDPFIPIGFPISKTQSLQVFLIYLI